MIQEQRGIMEKLKLHLDEIENKVFSVDFKGYSSYEVDSFGLVKHYENLISELSQENQRLKAKIASNDAASGQTQPSTLDLIRRVSRLEEIVLRKNQE